MKTWIRLTQSYLHTGHQQVTTLTEHHAWCPCVLMRVSKDIAQCPCAVITVYQVITWYPCAMMTVSKDIAQCPCAMITVYHVITWYPCAMVTVSKDIAQGLHCIMSLHDTHVQWWQFLKTLHNVQMSLCNHYTVSSHYMISRPCAMVTVSKDIAQYPYAMITVYQVITWYPCAMVTVSKDIS